jgi:hypothetical protein
MNQVKYGQANKNASYASVPRHSFCSIQSVTESTVQGAIRSEWQALYKDCNAVMSTQTRSRRASRKALIRGVRPLGKGAAIPGESCLAAKRFPTR